MECFMRAVTKGCLTLILGFTLIVAMTPAVGSPQTVASEGPSQVTAPARTQVTSAVELPSVQEANCKKLALGGRGPLYEQCLSVRSILAVMSVEPRATAWADAIETSLQKWIESLEPDGFTFRNVECRLSWCVIEAGSTIGAGDRRGHDIVLDSAEARKLKIFQVENMFARDSDDANLWDVVVFFKRYCTSKRELFDGNGHLVPDYYTLGQKC
jgi:hypothetical protein